MREPIPGDLLRFIEAKIDSVEQLEILRVLSERAPASLSAGELARTCQIIPSAIGAQLSGLKQRGLLNAPSQDAQTMWSHGASTDEQEDFLRRLLQCYRERPVTLIRLITNRRTID